MTQTAWNLSGNSRALVNVRTASALVFALIVLLSLPVSARSAEGPLPTFSNLSAKDVEIESRILRALRQDNQLKPLNLGVHLSSGTATLSGPVPTAELKQRAVQIVQRIDGVLAVNDKDLYISTSAQGRKRLTIPLQDDGPSQTRAASPHAPSTVQAAPVSVGQQITLLAPEMVAPSASVPEAARLTANPRPASPSLAIATAVEELRRRDTRYQQIRARVQGTTVYIVPGEAATEDAMTFAQAVRRVPGVQHVIMESTSR
jgi:osmotically-inducible protein OsmY